MGGKYHFIREEIAKIEGKPAPNIYTSSILPPWAYSKIDPSGFVPFFQTTSLAETVKVDTPMPMETIPLSKRIGQNFGYILYKNKIVCKNIEDTVIMRGLKSKLKGRAHFYVDESEVGKPILLENEESTKVDSVEFNIEKLQFEFSVLVENPGRVNFDNQISLDGEYKG